MTSLRQLRKGLAIYKTARSPYWMVRLRDPAEGRYIVRSTKEESGIEAISAANEFADSFFKRANSDQARKTTTSFEYYATQMLGMQKPSAKTHDSDRKLLYRQKDGIVRHFGDYDVTKITTKMIREYLLQLDKARGKPLADSTRAKHLIVIRKVLTLAVEDGLMKTIPVMPKQKTTDTPRHSFTDDEHKKFMKAAADCVSRGDEVRGVRITGHHVRMFKFLVHSFLRPTKGELFGLRHKDIKVGSNPPHLEMSVHGGKTCKRTSVTTPICVPLYKGMLSPFSEEGPDPNAFVWLPEYTNRTTAIDTARRIFNHILAKANLVDDEKKLSPYSLRHYALQSRLRSSNGKVNIYTLAKNAGTSVDQLERFYLKNMAPTKEMIENLHWRDEG
ncbi:recombinase [Rhodobacter capsulatus B6]|nr:recombinase [Rhodobacter capsulatus B6]